MLQLKKGKRSSLMELIAFSYYHAQNEEYVALAPDIEFCVAYGESEQEAVEALMDIVEVTLEDAPLPKNFYTVQHYSKKVLLELEIPQDATLHTLEITEDGDLSYEVTRKE